MLLHIHYAAMIGVLIINNDRLIEKTISTNYLYRGRIINVRQDQVKTFDQKIAFREIVEHPGAVAIIAIDEKDQVILVRQHRQPAGAVLYEIPAGKLEAYEEPLDCARREFMEETAMDADEWHDIYAFYPSPGFSNEIIYLYRAKGLKYAESSSSDPDENIEIKRIPLTKAKEMVMHGEIVDGKTIIALQYILLNHE